MVRKVGIILLYCVPIVVMIGLIPFVTNDSVLAVIYLCCIVALLLIKRERNDLPALFTGLVGMTISESFFVSTGVETFSRQTLFGLMPLWLPLLWAYGFVTIKRCLGIFI